MSYYSLNLWYPQEEDIQEAMRVQDELMAQKLHSQEMKVSVHLRSICMFVCTAHVVIPY